MDFDTEVVIYKREFTKEQRRKLAQEGKALPDGSYPIETAADLHPAAVLARSGHGDVDAAKALIGRRAKALKVPNPLDDSKTEDMEKSEVGYEARLWKGEREGKFYAVAIEPDLEDSQGDIVPGAEAEKACHEYMLAYKSDPQAHEADLQHGGRSAGAVLIENYIAPQDLTLAGQPVRKGAWVQAYQVEDPIVKQEIDEGKITGLSIEGSGFRKPITA